MATLTEITAKHSQKIDRLKAIERDILDAGGEVTDEQDEEYNRLLDEILRTEEAAQEKIDAYGAVMTELEQEIESIKGRAKPVKEMVDNLRSRRKALERNRERMKDRLMHYLREVGEERVEGDSFRFRRQTNGGRRSVDVSDDFTPEDVPEKYTRRKFDYGAIREDLKRLEDLREHYHALREEYEAQKGADDGAAAKIAARARSLYQEIEDLENEVEGLARLEERGEHIRKF